MKHLILATCMLLAAACAGAPEVAPTAPELAIVGARVHPAPGVAPIAEATIILRNGVIADVGPASSVRAAPSARIIDGRGLTVVAGLWNSHVHIFSPTMTQASGDPAAISAEMEAMLTRWGFTTVFDISSLPGQAIALRQRIRSGEITGPNLLTVDAPIFPINGTPIYARDLLAGQPSFEVGTTDLATQRVRQQLAAGADGVKLFTGAIVGPPQGVLPMQLDVAKAAVAEAHRSGKPVFAHPSDLTGLRIAMDSGADILAHATPDDGLEWTPQLVQELKSRNLALIPTLTLWKVELKRAGRSDAAATAFAALAQRQLKAYSDAGGEILFGRSRVGLRGCRRRRGWRGWRGWRGLVDSRDRRVRRCRIGFHGGNRCGFIHARWFRRRRRRGGAWRGRTGAGQRGKDDNGGDAWKIHPGFLGATS